VYPCTSTSTADFDHLGIGNINDPDFPAEFWRIWRDPAKWRHNVQCCPDCTRFEYDVNVEIDQRLAKLRGQGGLPEERERAQATKAIEKRGGTAAEEVL
jgi:hypothetical protein